LALVGPMTIAEKGLSTALISKDQNSAFNLAQDAIELVRFSRDTNCLRAGPVAGGCPAASWLAGTGVNLTNCISTTGATSCYLDSLGQNPAAPTTCPSNICPVINYDSSNNYFTYAAAGGSVTSTIFTRAVQITYDPTGCLGACNPAEADITVTVSWSDPVTHSISVTESLYNWQ
jgi:hypothetical protein